MYIYKITNIENGKVYIGQTVRSIQERFKRHITDAENQILDTHFARAIRKYGKEKFQIECIDTATSQEELTLKEKLWIDSYKACKSKYGYNETCSTLKCGGNTYISKTEEEMNLIKDKIRKSKVSDKNPNSRSVKCLNITTGEELFFKTVSECKNFFQEKHHRFITTRTNHTVKGLYKNIWAIAYASDEYVYEKIVDKEGCKVMAKNILTGEVKIYKSIRKCCRDLKINRSTLRKHIRNSNEYKSNNYIITILN